MVIIADANLWTQFSTNNSEEFVDRMMRRVWLKNLLRQSAMFHFFVEVKLHRFYYKYRKKFIPIEPENDTLYEDQRSDDPYGFFKRSLENLCGLLNEHDLKGLIIYIPREDEVLSNRKSKILPIKQAVSKIYNIPLIDFTGPFSHSRKNLYLEGDSVHPNTEGNRIITLRIFDFLTANKNNWLADAMGN